MSKVEGLNEVLKKLSALEKDVSREVEETLNVNAEEIARNAKLNLRTQGAVDTGKLLQSIIVVKEKPLERKVSATQSYAPYIEFGTGVTVDVPPELTTLAIQFKGKGIRQINLPARPFLYPAFKKQRKVLLKDLEDLLEHEARKF